MPDFRWTSFYYPEILQALIRLKRSSWPEHTEEDQADPVVQLLRMFAVVGHLGAVRLDHVAREVYLPTAQLRSSVVALAALVGYRLAPASPATAWLLGTVSGALSGTEVLVKAHSTYTTIGSDPVIYEYMEDDDLEGGPAGSFRVLEDDGGVVTDITGVPTSLWAGTAAKNDALYIGGDAVLAFDRIQAAFSVAAASARLRWEYRDDRSGQPDDVTDLGGSIRFTVDSVIGANPDSPNGGAAVGLALTVKCLRTGSVQAIEVNAGVAPNTATATGTLGQVTVSTNPADYLITTEWVEVPDVVDESTAATVTGDSVVEWSAPFATDRRWLPSDPEGSGVDGYWIRARWAWAAPGGAPTLDEVVEARRTTYWVAWDVRQGQQVTDKLGASDETASQEFTLSRSPFLELVSLTVDGSPWTRVDNFLASSSYDRHFTLLEQVDGSWVAGFGDGTTGKIPALSAEIVATYRIGGDVSGNVGPETIRRARTGSPRIRAVTNPAAAEGWTAQEGTTDASLDALRTTIPASLRAMDRAVTLADCEAFAVAFTDSNGARPVSRALAVSEGLGPKTVTVVCVGPDGDGISTATLLEMLEYFNGEDIGVQRVGGIAPANTLVVPVSYLSHAINVVATVRVLAAYVSGAEAAIEAAIARILSPLATRQILEDGVWVDTTEWLWVWEQDVETTAILSAIYTAHPGIVGITLTAPAAAVVLAPTELPTPGTVVVTVVPV